jgi:hypothetical protein
MEFFQTNWVWLLLVVGAIWLLFRGGCGMGRRDAKDQARRADRNLQSRGPGDNASGEGEHAGHRGHRGC